MIDGGDHSQVGSKPMEQLRKLIEANETWLTERVLALAQAHGYTADSSTLELPWRASVCGFSDPMRAMLSEDRFPPEISHDTALRADLIAAFSVEEARLHRLRGVPLHQFMGLTNYYRRAYLDLIELRVPRGAEAEACKRFINLFFDNSEIAVCLDWERQISDGDRRHVAETNIHLTKEKNRYLTIFESLNTPIILVDTAGKLVNRNLAASLLFDGAARAGEGYYRPEAGTEPVRRIEGLIDRLEGYADAEIQLETRRGPRTFQIKTQEMLDVSEKFTGTVVILTDITELRNAQEASEGANRAKSAFLATMSHEIRTPINGILGIGQLLREAPLYELQSTYIDALLTSGEMLLEQVNAVLDYSKLEAGDTGLRPVPFAPRELVRRIERLSIGEVRRRGLELVTDVSDTCPETVLGDGEKIQRILVNLVSNAVKFTETGRVTLSVTEADGRIDFAVRDTGPGIEEADQDIVFEPFVQRTATAGNRPEGTGRGLAICRRLAETLHADLTLEHPEGGGALFRLVCPVEATGPETEPRQPHLTPLRDLDILLVEDNAVNAMVIEGFLEADAHRITTVSGGEAALERVGTARYDLILLDIRLRGMDGFETIGKIRSNPDPAIGGLPVLILTADQSDEIIHQFARSGANAFQSKPFSRDELRLAIARAMTSPPIRVPDWQEGVDRQALLLDPTVIFEHRNALGPARTRRILQTFIETADDHRHALRAAAAARDAARIADLAHSMKSAAGICGLHALSNAAARAERTIAGGEETADFAEISEGLCEDIAEASGALSAFLAADQPADAS